MADFNPPVLDGAARRAVSCPLAPTLPELVHRWIRDTPDALALSGGGHHLSYGELGRRASGLARRLAALGVGPEVPVGVCLPPSPEMVVAWLAVVRAGGAYVPLDPEHPVARRRWTIDDAGVRALICEDTAGRELAGTSLPILEIQAAVEPGPRRRPVPPLPDHPAYVLYTSGSTGRPKGVAVTHRSLANVLDWYRRRYRMAPGARSSQIASPGFDASVLEIWPALAAGATVVFPASPLRGSARELGRFLTREGVDVAFVPPVIAREIAEASPPPPLRAMILGGDRAPSMPPLPFPVYNHYGPTEATVQVTAALVEPDDPAPPIGRPIDGVEVRLLDDDLEPVDAGAVGEIWVTGAGVSRGYVGRPARTAEAFRPDPFAQEPGERMYRTGDLGRRRPDGCLEFRGRVDDQVKVRGVRVEPGEVAAVLEEHPAVRHAAVALREPAPGDERLVAWVVPEDGGERPEDDLPVRLRRHLTERLPAAFVPAAIQPVAELPRTPRGKVDRDALPTPNLADLAPRRPRRAPRTERQRTLLTWFQEVLGIPDLGIEDDFFDLGGHSLLATRLVSRIRRRWGVELPVGAVFDKPTVAGLARQVETAEGRERALPPIEPRPQRGDVVPLSYAQQRLWFLDRLQPANPFYNIPVAWRLEGRIAPRALTQAVGEIVRRHEALRTRLPARGGEARQQVDPPAPWTVREVDLTALAEPDRNREAHRLGRRETGRPFRLDRDRLVRTARLRPAPERSVFLLTIHHVVADGWSLGVLVDEIAPLYEAWTRGRPSPLAEPPIQYPDFALWQREHVAGEFLERELDHWQRRLVGAPRLELPLDRPRPTVQTFRGARQRFTLDADSTGRLRDLSRRHGASLFMTLLAGFEALLTRLTGETDLVLGVPVANRHREELEGLVGFFVNSLALRTDLSGDPAFAEAVERVRETTLDAYAHQDLPFERLVERIAPERDLSKNPLFQVMFVLQNVPAPERNLGETRLSTLPVALHTTRFDLEVHLFETGDGLEGFLFYDRDLFDPTTVERLHRMYSRLLAAAGGDPERSISGLPLLTPAQRHHLVREHNDVAAAYPADATLDRLFHAVAAATPDAVALAFDDHAVTYGELARRAHGWALRLTARGVRPGDRVGLLLPRSPEMIVGTLAVLEAGAAYVPLDPDYPPRRLELLTEDAGLGLILSTPEHLDSLPQDLPESVGVWDLASPGLTDAGIVDLPASGSRRRPQSLAYVIYTSGSTGRPKGVAVADRAVIRLVRDTDYVRLTPADRVAHASNVAFDAATFEIWGALLTGGTLVGISKWVALTPEAMARKLAEERVTTLFLTTALFQQLVREAPGGFAGLTHLLFGGEACDPNRVRELLEGDPPRRLLHVYGPTESTTYATWHRVETVPDGAVTVPIGGPLANTTAHVVDPELGPVPLGAPGELVLGADGLARGYLGRPELTAQRFVPDPHASAPGGRLYRTGDRVRRQADGPVEFLGRVDHQVKLRGFRIELGEIETALLESPWVREVVAQVREDSPGDRRLVAYVVPTEEAEEIEPEEDDGERLEEQVSRWEMIFDNIYGDEETHGDATFNIVGWRSTYTGEPLPAEDMREWLDDTVGRILDAEPHRVLEIGCGTGLLLFRIAPRVERYLGLDLSQRALDYVDRQRRSLPEGLPGVTLAQAPADDFRHVEAGAFDTVILNSVVQYFPSVDYLVRVIENAVSALGPEGRIFLGDLRSLPLLETFHTGVQLYQAEDDLPLAQLRHRVRTALEEEEELALDPALFYVLARHLPEIRRVEVFPKRGRADHELTRFRYQVVLTVRKGDLREPPPEAPALEGRDPDAVRHFVETAPDDRDGAAWKDLPNARLIRELAVVELLASPPADVETVGDLKARLAALPAVPDPQATHPQDLWELSTGTWAVTPSWGRHGADGRLDAVARRREASETLRAPEPFVDPRKPWSAYSNDPLRGKFARRVAPRLEAWLGERLPTYMIPALFVPLPEMPLNPNGKVDRKALPVPESLGAGSTAEAAPPRTPEEQAVAQVWCDVLGLESVGVEDDFFDLGGHSLLGTQVVSRLRKTLGVELPLSALFETPKLGDLAQRIARLTGAGEPARETPSALPLEPLARTERDGDPPLSFAQERLWFLDRLESGGSFYNSGAAFDLQGPLSAPALDGTLIRLLARHEALRTTFPLVDGEPVQRIALPAPARVARVDLSGLESADARRTARHLLGRAYRRLFDLAAGPLARFALLHLGPRDHRLSLAVHHAVFDGWSLGVVVREIAELYVALAAGRPDPLPEPEIQYADFAVWQRRWLTGAVLERQLDYWRRRLDGAPEVELPLDRPRPPAQRFRGDTVALELPAEAAENLARLARNRGTTLYTVLLAGLETLLSRYSGQVDLVVGTPVANRNRQEIEGLVGFFANTLVMRGDLSEDPPFGTLVERLAVVTLEAYAHQDLPFERLVEELQPERDLSRNPIFQVMLALQNAPLPPLEMDTTTLELLPWEGETARFDLEIHVWEGEGGLAGELIYDVDLFDRTTVRRFAQSYEALLSAAAGAPERRLSQLPVLSPAQHHQVRSEWQGAPPPAAGADDLVGVFLRVAAQQPDAVAVAAGDAVVTYAELARRSLRLAHSLRRAGVGPDVLVGVCLPRSPAAPRAVLAILAAGGAYVPLDPAYPAERLAFMIEDSRVPLLLTAGETEPIGRELAGPAVRRLDLDSSDPAALEPLEPVPPPPEALAYLIYTSGSTGRPKGVAMTRSVLAHLIAWQVAEAPRPRRTLQFAPLSFDVSFQELFATWAVGGTLVLVDEETRRQPTALWEEVARQQVERLFLPFVALDQLAETAAGDPARLVPGLREVITAGEQLRTTPALTTLFEALPQARLVNQYGPSETHVATAYELPPDPARWTPLPPVGRPVAGGVARVLGRRGEPVPVGGTGELYLGGVCPARGYLRRPARTAASFVPDPLTHTPGARLYRTGDLARWDAGGDLRFLGRVDQQVKVRGFRVEPGEVEAVLAEHPNVAEAVVVASETEGSAERRLVAHVQRREGTEDLAVWLRERLPEYLVPSAFVTVDSFPLTPSGKVDRGRLARQSLERSETTPYVPPRTATEVVVANVWTDVLGVERVGARDHFFRLGGHSLLATRVLAHLRQELDLELPLKDLFEAPTVAGLAQRAERTIRRRPLPSVTPAPRDGDLPLSFAQQRLWLVDRLEPGTALYNFPLPLRLEGSLRTTALEQALGEIRRRHEVLRSTFPAAGDDGDPVQRVAPPATFRLPRVDLAHLRETDRERESRRLTSEAYLRPFDLAADDLWRSELLRLGGDVSVLTIHTHHIVFDGASIGVFFHELADLYGAVRAGRPSSLPEPDVQYGDFAAWQRTHLTDLVLAEQLAHWRRRLAGVAPLELPTDRPRPPVAGSGGGRFEATLSAPAHQALHELADRRGTTPFVTALAATTALLGRLADQDDVAVGTPVAGRTREEVRDLLGFFVQTLVLRTSLAGDPDFLELAARAEETWVAAHGHQDVPFERLVAELAEGRDLSRNPLFQVMLAYQELPEEETRLPGLTVSPAPFEITTSKFDLTLSLTGTGPGLRAAWAYRTDLFDETTVRRFARAFETLLVGAAAEPDRSVDALPLLVTPERHQTLVEWNEPDWTGPVPAPTLRAALAARAAERPDAVALVSGDRHLSYGQMSHRAAALAEALRRTGAGPGSRVGVCLERRAETTIALLGILEAGAAYVPLDPAFPDQRLSTLVAEARPVAVITDARWQSRVPPGPRRLRVDRPVKEPDAAMHPGLQPWERHQRGRDLPVYVLFTSGSTGRPKGVVVPNRAVLHRLGWAVTHEPGAERLLQKVSLGFDISVAEVFLPLLAGGTTILAQPGGEKDGAYLARLIDRERIGLAGFATSSLENLLEHGDLLDGTSLRRVLVGAEVVPPDLPGRFARHVGAELFNRYGPTEATVSVLSWPCRPGEVGHALPVGRPIAGTRVYLLDRRLEPAPLGVPGQIHLGGPCLATGYLARPGRTAAAFVPHPLAGEPGERLYATGDLGRFRGDGALLFLGRIDHQVKVRGLRVELEEVETTLARHPEVDRAAVLLAGDRLVAWVAPEGTAPDELIQWVAARLPAYMVPAAVGLLPELPATTSGKVDRRALADRPLEVSERGAAGTPATPTEELLALLWAEVLDVESATPADDFFDLGGHSLLATRLTSRVRRVFGVELPLAAVFEASELRALAARIDQARRRDDGVSAPPLEPSPAAATPEPSFGQERLWILDRLEESRRLYLIPAALRLEGPFRPRVLGQAWGEVLRRHQALRTVLPEDEDGRPAIRVLPPTVTSLLGADLSGLAPQDREAEARRLAAAETRRPMEVERGPLTRFRWLRLGARDHVALVTLHHVVADGWSLGVVFRQLGTLLQAFGAGTPSPLAEPSLQYADFTAWQRRWLTDEILEARVDWWRRRLAGVDRVLELPTDRPRPPVQKVDGAEVTRALPRQLTADLTAFGRRHGATPFLLLLATWGSLLARLSGQEAVLVGTPMSGRDRVETEDLVGFFVNTLALPVRPDPDGTFLDLLARVREDALAGFAHQDLPFERLVDELVPERRLDRSPLIQVMLAVQNAAEADRRTFELPGLDVSVLPVETSTTHFELTLAAVERHGVLSLSLVYAASLFDATTARRFLKHLETLLESALAAPEAPVAELPWLDDAQRHQALVEGIDLAATHHPPAAPREPAELLDGVPEEAPRWALEARVAAIFAEVLGASEVVPGDSFFDLGGHSLLATRVTSRIRHVFGVELPLRTVFEHPTVAALARRVDAERMRETAAAPPPLAPAAPDAPPVPSFGQERLWYLEQLEESHLLYLIPLGLRLTGDLVPRAFAAAWGEVLRRQRVLRTALPGTPDGPGIRVEPVEVPARVPLADLSGLTATRRETELRRLRAAEVHRPMDLETGPVVRSTLVRLAPTEHAWLLTLHHVAADGWSVEVLLRELGTLRSVFSAGRPSPLVELPVQYSDFAAWQRRWLTGDVLTRHVSWWRERLAAVPETLELRTDRPRPPAPSFAGADVEAWLSEPLSAELEDVSRRHGATPFLVLLALWGSLLARLSGQSTVAVGTPVAGRDRLDLEGLVGLFVNTLVLPVRPRPESTFLDLLERVREETLGAFAHQDLPFDRLVEELAPARHLDRSPLFQVALSVESASEAGERSFELPGLEVASLPGDFPQTQFELTLGAVRRRGRWHLSLAYRTDLFDATTVKRQLGQLVTALEGVLTAPQTPVAELPWLDDAQRHQLLAEWNDTATVDVPPPTLVHLVLDQAREVPDAVAVVDGVRHLSYGELARRAGSLAVRAKELGVAAETPVAVCLEPSLEMVWAWLGVLAAGGVYVPLAPEHPDARLTDLMADAGARRVVVGPEPAGRFAGAGFEELPICAVEVDPPSELPEPEPEPDRLAYVLYTSGSTGKPKGVLVAHGGLVALMRWYRRFHGLDPGRRMSQWASPAFDASVLEVWTGLASGATVAVAPLRVRSSAQDLARWLEREAVDVAFLAPVLARELVAGDRLPPLRRLILGGDRAPRLSPLPFPVLNHYGPTEITVMATAGEISQDGSEPPIGRPIDDFRLAVLDPALQPVPPGVSGELWISGPGLARGYRNRPRQTAEAFRPNPFATEPGERAYRTGDLAAWRTDGRLDFVGRADDQVKVRGVRVELGEVEAVLGEHPEVLQAVADLRRVAGDDRLVAWIVPSAGAPGKDLVREIRDHAARHLPQTLRPSFVVQVDEIPRTDRGKVDRDLLPTPALEAAGPPAEPAGAETRLSSLESEVARAFEDVLGVTGVGPRDSFFDLGGHSLLLVRLRSHLQDLGHDLPLLDFFRHPTVRSLAARLAETAPEAIPVQVAAEPEPRIADRRVAVVGLAGRFPKAPDADTLWRNLEAGVEGITYFTDEELAARGVERELLADPHYVKGRGLVDDVDRFDAEFFGYAPREAQILDPQQRVFLEICWQALEDAGCDPERFDGRVGVFAAASPSEYLSRLHTRPDLVRALGHLQMTLGNQQDFLATRVSYELDLKGPSVSVATACSSSLTAVHLAVRSLVDGECDLALAGGVSIAPLSRGGYLHHPGGISSPDGHTRTFDARGAGTVSSDGAGVVVLRRLEDARAGGDPVRAVILGSAFNNDGSHKIGFTAPSVDGQAEVIRAAQRAAGVEASSIGYVEAHGTATHLGDPIEVAALTRAFREAGDPRRGVCALGSVKSNLGHLDAAAGVTGLIKTVLALEHGTIPASLHFEEPNPELGLDASPFRVAAATEPWEAGEGPRRAGVSSFGLGGTNVHVVLEEAPEAEAAEPPHRSRQLLVLSARTSTALAAASERLASHLETSPDAENAGLADVAWTLQTGRKGFPHRRVLVAETREDAVEALRASADEVGAAGLCPENGPSLVYLVPAAGVQYPGMGEGLYRGEPVFRQAVDQGAEILKPLLGLDLRRLLFASAAEHEAADRRLRRTDCAMPAIVLMEIALALLLESWGLAPEALVGHSLGEYAVAHLAGVLSFEDILTLVAERGRLFAGLPAGAMLSVELPADEVARRLPPELSLSAVNGPALVNVSGPEQAVDRLDEELTAKGVTTRRLHLDAAGHSSLVEPILEPFGEFLQTLDLAPPKRPYVSGLTGDWIRPEEATDPRYWVRHLRETARFADGAGRLLADPDRVFLEVGPGRTLATLTRRHPARRGQGVHTSMNPPGSPRSDQEVLLEAVGRLWIDGVEPDWAALHATDRRRVSLPTYPFERRRCWVEAGDGSAPAPRAVVEPEVPAAGSEGTEDLPEAPSAGDAAAAPETPLERRLAGFFRDLLGVDRLGRHDDFFELGGSSLLAVRLRSMLEETFGVTLSPHFLLEAPTVARLARLLETAGAEAAESTEPTEPEVRTDEPAVRARLRVRLQEGRPEETPLFLIHPVGGHVYFYRELAQELGGELPVWGLRASGLEPGEEPLGSIEEMADRYLKEVREVQPAGPYRLGGSSLGGVVAYEMARHLADRGEDVSFLALLDAPGPGHLPPRPADEAELLAQLFGELLGLDADELRALDPESRLELVVEAFRRSDEGIGERFGVEEARRQVQVLRAGMAALFAYEGGSYDGSVLFLRARVRRPQDPAHPELAWIDRAAGVEVHVVPGDHVSMHQPPHRSVLVERLRCALDRSRREVVTG